MLMKMMMMIIIIIIIFCHLKNSPSARKVSAVNRVCKDVNSFWNHFISLKQILPSFVAFSNLHICVSQGFLFFPGTSLCCCFLTVA